MRILVQWATAHPTDWLEATSEAWGQLPSKPVPRGHDIIDTQPGWVNALNIQGVTFSADHYAVEALPHGGCRVTTWNDDPGDFPDGEWYGFVRTFLPLAPDPRFGDAYNTRQTVTVYAQPDAQRRLAGFGWRDMQPWEDFPHPAPALVRHGIWMPDALYARLEAARRVCGWREWTDGVPPEFVQQGRVVDQRRLGRYLVPQGTKTVFARSTNRATGIHAAIHEDAFEETTGTPTTETRTIPQGTEELGWCFTSATDFPTSAAWPTGDYRFQIDVSALDANITFGLLTIGGAAGHFARVNAALTSDLETKVQQEGAFSASGLSLATTGSVSWSTGATSDRFECLLAIANSNGHNTRDITLELDETDDFADGPWLGDETKTVTDTASGNDSPAVTATTPVQDTGAAVEALLVAIVGKEGAFDILTLTGLWVLQPGIVGDETKTITENGTGTDTLTIAATAPLVDAAAGAFQLHITTATSFTETGTGVDSPDLAANVPVGEPGSGADVALPGASVPQGDTGSGTEAVPIAARVPLAEIGTGVDALTVARLVSISETSNGQDTVANIAASVPQSDSGTGVDAVATSAFLLLSDVATSSDALQITVVALVGDIATGTDTPVILILRTVAETASGTDSPDLSADVPVGEPGSGQDAVSPGALVPVAENGTGLDAVAVARLITINESATGVESPDLAANASVGEPGSGQDAILPGASVPLLEAGAGAEASSIAVRVLLGDNAAGVDAITVARLITIGEQGTGQDAVANIAASVPITESGVGADTPQIAVALSLADAANVAEAISVAASLLVAETGAGADSPSVLILRTVTEQATGVDVLDFSADVPVGEPGSGQDATALGASVSFVDTGNGADALTATNSMALAESGTSADAFSLTADVPVGETGAGTDSATASQEGDALYTTIDEPKVNDADYAESSLAPSSDVFEVLMDSVADPAHSMDHLVRYRLGKDVSGGAQIDIIVTLLDGGTTIASWTETDVSDTPTTLTRTLTDPQADSIGNYGDLRLRFSANQPSGTPDRRARVYWCDLCLPTPQDADQTKTVKDTGAGAEGLPLAVSFSQGDIGAGADSPDLSANVPVGDPGSGQDAVPAPGVLAPIGEASAGEDIPADIAAVVPVIDLGTDSERPIIAASLNVGETASGLDDPAILLFRTVTDAGASVESIGIQATVPIPDASQGETVTDIAAQLLVAEAGTGLDAVLRLILITLTETAIGLDAVGDIQVTATVADPGQATASLTITATIPVKENATGADNASRAVQVVINELATGLDSTRESIQASMDETATGLPVLTIQATVPVGETQSVADIIAALAALTVFDSGSGVDASDMIITVPVSDDAAGTDTIAQILAALQVTDANTLPDSVVRSVVGEQVIVTMAFAASQRSMVFSSQSRRITFTLQRRSMILEKLGIR